LYFFHGQEAVVLTHSFQKEDEKVPDEEIRRANARRALFESSPEPHSFLKEIGDA